MNTNRELSITVQVVGNMLKITAPSLDSVTLIRFTEAEIADFLKLVGITNPQNLTDSNDPRLLPSKAQKLKFANWALQAVVPALWEYAGNWMNPNFRQAEWLARRLSCLEGLMSVIKLAEVR